MKQTHGYRKGECDPKDGRQLTICGRPIYKIDRRVIHIHGEHGSNKVNCSTCLARIHAINEQKLPHAI